VKAHPNQLSTPPINSQWYAPLFTSKMQPVLSPQDAVAAGGPLLVILGFIIFPIIWSIPEALITAELATAFPENSGYVAWVTAAFGPFWGFQVGGEAHTGSST
jgi:hypothetical protein